MSPLEAAKARYATKKYDPSKKIDAEKLTELKDILCLSPSSINSQPWHFSFIRDPELKAKLADASFFNAQRIKDADTLVVFSAVDDIEFFQKQISSHLPDGSVSYFMDQLKTHGEEAMKQWFHKQVYLSLGVLLSACAVMEIDSTPMEGIDAAKYNELLHANGKYTALCAVAMGYRDPMDTNQPSIKPKSRKPFELVLANY